MGKKKIVIIGSSIAGASAALLLSGNPKIEVVVYEQKPRSDIGKKLCDNIVSKTFLKMLKILGIEKSKGLFRQKFSKAVFSSENSKREFSVEDYKLNRNIFLDLITKKSSKKGVKFNFETRFAGFSRNNRKFIVSFEKEGKKFNEDADILIGADGILSKVSESAGFRKPRFFIALESPIKNFNLIFKKDAWNVFLKPEFGYYSFFDYEYAGIEGKPENIKKCAQKFFSFLGNMHPKNLKSALIPEPSFIRHQKNLFIIGDAAGQVKFNGGGIIPAIKSAVAIKEIILNNNYKILNEANSSQKLNIFLLKLLGRMNEKDWESLLKILKEEKFDNLITERDELKEHIWKFFDFRLLKFLFKLI